MIATEKLDKVLSHIESPFSWVALTPNQQAAVYWHVRGYSAQRSGETVGASRHTVRKRLERAVEKINAAEDWNIEVRDLADVFLKLIQEELDGN